MSSRRRRLARRLISGAVEVVGDRAPWLSDQAYRVVAAPLQWLDPVGGARAAEARLDDLRDRVAGMAASGRIGRAEQRRIRRDLVRTREDLERVAPRLPAVQARALSGRLAAYAEILGAFPAGRPTDPGARNATRARDAVILTGTAAGACAGALLPLAGTTAAVEGGLSAGVTTALGVTALQNRRARRARIRGLADALAEVDRATLGPTGLDPRDLDRERRALVRRALDSGRLDERGRATLHRIDAHLDDLLLRLVAGDLDAGASHLVQATITRYLPDSLEPLLALSDPRAFVRGRPAAVEVADQLTTIERGVAEAARRTGRNQPETDLLLQSEFLRSKFGESSTGAPADPLT